MGFYPASDDQLSEVAQSCQLRYGLTPRTEWLKVGGYENKGPLNIDPQIVAPYNTDLKKGSPNGRKPPRSASGPATSRSGTCCSPTGRRTLGGWEFRSWRPCPKDWTSRCTSFPREPIMKICVSTRILLRKLCRWPRL